MRTKILLLALGALLAVGLLAAGCARQQPAEQPQQTEQPAEQPAEEQQAAGGGNPENGKSIYDTRCSACHAPDGSGGVGPALKGVADRLSEADHIAVVTDGRGAMPSFKGQLSEQEIKDVVAYERTLQ